MHIFGHLAKKTQCLYEDYFFKICIFLKYVYILLKYLGRSHEQNNLFNPIRRIPCYRKDFRDRKDWGKGGGSMGRNAR